MTTLASDLLDMGQIAKRKDMLGTMADLLLQSHSTCSDGPIKRSNREMSHVSGQIVGYPSVGYSSVNGFTSSSRSTVQNVEDIIACARAYSVVDSRLIDTVAENGEAVRAGEDRTFINAMWDLVSESIFYGSLGDNADEFDGIFTRQQYSSTLSSTNPNVILCDSSAGSPTKLGSICLIKWGPDMVHLLAPKNGVSGMTHIDHGRQVLRGGSSFSTLSGSTWLTAYISEFMWFIGLAIKHPGAIVRIANVRYDLLQKNQDTQSQTAYATHVEYQIASAISRMPPGPGRIVGYCPRSIFEGLLRQRVIRGMSVAGPNSGSSGAGYGKDGAQTAGMLPTVYESCGVQFKIEDAMGIGETAVA